jgi:cytochrome oxidase Cu insertion factor (SCO1/SenC/PrrC family)
MKEWKTAMPRLLIIILATLCLIATGLFWYVQRISPAVPTGGQGVQLSIQPGAPTIGGTFSLTDDQNRPVTEKNLVGSKFHLLFFGFANCPDVCPGMLQTMAGVFEKLTPAEQARLQMVFISVDPARDTAEKLGAYVRGFNPNFVGWRGDKAQIDAMTTNYLAYYAQKPDVHAPDGYTMDHSALLYVMAPSGQYLTHLRNADSATFILERLREILAGA